MALLFDKARREIRVVAQWLNLALETPGETQARILYQASWQSNTHFLLSLMRGTKVLTASGDDVGSDSRRPERFPRP